MRADKRTVAQVMAEIAAARASRDRPKTSAVTDAPATSVAQVMAAHASARAHKASRG
jgi:hypothetical protein